MLNVFLEFLLGVRISDLSFWSSLWESELLIVFWNSLWRFEFLNDVWRSGIKKSECFLEFLW